MPVILAAQEAAVQSRRIPVQSQPWQIVPETLSRKYPTQERAVEWLKFKPQYCQKKKTKTDIL
jgi:hypothetical protein